MPGIVRIIVWVGVALLGAGAFGVLALARGETINAAWLVVAAVCSYLVGYRFYSRYIAWKVFGLDAHRATPAERLDNGRDFVPTSRWILFGHHFSAMNFE
jgi:carbon starvation protein